MDGAFEYRLAANLFIFLLPWAGKWGIIDVSGLGDMHTTLYLRCVRPNALWGRL